jgi:hypothetical protein
VILGPRYRWDDAVAHLKRAVEINPRHAEAYHNLAVVYGLQRRLDEGPIQPWHASSCNGCSLPAIGEPHRPAELR